MFKRLSEYKYGNFSQRPCSCNLGSRSLPAFWFQKNYMLKPSHEYKLKRSDAFVYFHLFLSIFVLYSMFSSFPFRNLKLCIFSLFKFVSNINKERTRNRVKHNTNVNVNFDVIYLSID